MKLTIVCIMLIALVSMTTAGETNKYKGIFHYSALGPVEPESLNMIHKPKLAKNAAVRAV